MNKKQLEGTLKSQFQNTQVGGYGFVAADKNVWRQPRISHKPVTVKDMTGKVSLVNEKDSGVHSDRVCKKTSTSVERKKKKKHKKAKKKKKKKEKKRKKKHETSRDRKRAKRRRKARSSSWSTSSSSSGEEVSSSHARPNHTNYLDGERLIIDLLVGRDSLKSDLLAVLSALDNSQSIDLGDVADSTVRNSLTSIFRQIGLFETHGKKQFKKSDFSISLVDRYKHLLSNNDSTSSSDKISKDAAVIDNDDKLVEKKQECIPKTVKIIGASKPPQGWVQQTSSNVMVDHIPSAVEESSEDECIGPFAAGSKYSRKADPSTVQMVAKSADKEKRRRRRMKRRMWQKRTGLKVEDTSSYSDSDDNNEASYKTSVPTQRDSWMTSLPDKGDTARILGALEKKGKTRHFRTDDSTNIHQDSSWTDTPGTKKKRKATTNSNSSKSERNIKKKKQNIESKRLLDLHKKQSDINTQNNGSISKWNRDRDMAIGSRCKVRDMKGVNSAVADATSGLNSRFS